jgi:microcystin-dependent protein
MWSGSIGAIPAGWFLCNGLNGTPNLQDRFVIGAGSGYAVNAIGGTANAIVVDHTHTLVDGGHAHSYNTSSATTTATAGGTTVLTTQASATTGSITTGITVNSTGSSGTGANLPPYFALAYIQKS